jgi:hypothetical protein
VNNDMKEMASLLMKRKPLQSLAPVKVWDKELDVRISNLNTPPHNEYAACVKSGLYLWNDSLDASHTLSQDIKSATGSYWHGIMHRMEPDYSNAKYWFRQVGDHPVYTQLRLWLSDITLPEKLPQPWSTWIKAEAWDPYGFIDLVSEARDTGAVDLIAVLEEIQRQEMRLLLQHSYKQYCGGDLFEPITP